MWQKCRTCQTAYVASNMCCSLLFMFKYLTNFHFFMWGQNYSFINQPENRFGGTGTINVFYKSLSDVISILNARLNDVQKEMFRSSCFGHFLHMSEMRIQQQIIHKVLMLEIRHPMKTKCDSIWMGRFWGFQFMFWSHIFVWSWRSLASLNWWLRWVHVQVQGSVTLLIYSAIVLTQVPSNVMV